jgi:large subunit ribosomal protein L27
MWVFDIWPLHDSCTYIVIVHQVKMGRDHTIYAISPGFVRFYKERWLSGDRRFVGLVLERGQTLPRDEAAFGRSRYCGLVNHNSNRVASHDNNNML